MTITVQIRVKLSRIVRKYIERQGDDDDDWDVQRNG